MDVVRAKTAGFCMGVSLALRKLDEALKDGSEEGRICTLGPIIHNPQVLASYEAKGVVCVTDTGQLEPGDIALVRAHGLTRKEEAKARDACRGIIDATCPRVKKAQLAIAEATRDGQILLLFGEANHPEIRGLVSYAQSHSCVFDREENIDHIPLNRQNAYVLASQTTQDRECFERIERSLRDRLESLVVLSTICDATRSRQKEARDIAAKVDIMVVVGGRQSGNTRRLADIASSCGITTLLVEHPDELDPAAFEGKRRAGLTAGASTPKDLIDEAHRRILSL
ncbi:MAG: 4-hydroxy-3-methylbut-2-enyl diphosphate reductase [Desulfovibrio sp.]|jgi:4-hydroxy-3-methylbut-2-enyl diphosphate reductase|nr:4-hydroxy-3-methylbut-2-enyl diphosphate reductase [Desulfovibrio sp.]